MKKILYIITIITIFILGLKEVNAAEVGDVYWKVDNNILYLRNDATSGYAKVDEAKVNDAEVYKTNIPWGNSAGTITKVVIENEIRPTNTNYYFYYMHKLATIENIANLNTSNVTDMESMFRECGNLTQLDLRSFNTSQVTNMSYMFYGCWNLTQLDLSNFDTSKVTSMFVMFVNCSSLTTLDLSSFNTSQVTTMRDMFFGCSKLTTLNLGSFNTSKVTDMARMFQFCRNLTQLDLRSFNTSKVTNMDSMFEYCSNLITLDLSNFDTSNVTDMSEMFYGCSNLTQLDLSNFDLRNVKDLKYILYGCENLEILSINFIRQIYQYKDLPTIGARDSKKIKNLFPKIKINSNTATSLTKYKDIQNITNDEYDFYFWSYGNDKIDTSLLFDSNEEISKFNVWKTKKELVYGTPTPIYHEVGAIPNTNVDNKEIEYTSEETKIIPKEAKDKKIFLTTTNILAVRTKIMFFFTPYTIVYYPFQISKTDEKGNMLKGAQFQIIDKDKDVLYEFTSDNKTVEYAHLPEGEFTIKEVKTPFGYEKSKDIKISVDESGKVTSKDTEVKENKLVVIKNKQIVNNPKTGNILYMIPLIISLIGASIMYFINNKKIKRKFLD